MHLKIQYNRTIVFKTKQGNVRRLYPYSYPNPNMPLRISFVDQE